MGKKSIVAHIQSNFKIFGQHQHFEVISIISSRVDHDSSRNALNSHFTYGHTHDIKYTSESYSMNSYDKPKFNQNSRNSNQQEPKKIWVPTDKINYVADVFNNKVETPVLIHGLWTLSTNDWKKAYVPKSGT